LPQESSSKGATHLNCSSPSVANTAGDAKEITAVQVLQWTFLLPNAIGPPVMATTVDNDDASTADGQLLHIVSQLGMATTHEDERPLKRPCTIHLDDVPSTEEQALLQQLKALVAEFQMVQSKPPEPFTDSSSPELDLTTLHAILDQNNITYDGVTIYRVFNPDNLLAFAAGMNNNTNTLTQSQMLKANDCADFLKSQVSKLSGLEEAQVFEYLPMSELPPHTCLINAIWSYCCKQCPNGSLLKHKSHICVDGSMQQYRVDFWDTYSPVIHWSTICMVLVLLAILGLKARQVDYTQAFPQAPPDDPAFMQIPQGWTYNPISKKLIQSNDPKQMDHDHFIRLHWNLYGCKQAA
jgi:hypothetical protein